MSRSSFSVFSANENSAVTAVYKGTAAGGQPAVLRSYDSRKEPSPEFDCKIWEAGRATSAIGLAFKPAQVGQSVFHDDGSGKFNPTPVALDEACVNEWPGRDVGVLISVGTGKRPPGNDHNQHLWYEGFMGEFAEARRRLISKIEGCEETHQYVKKEYLSKRGVNIENYYRFNVEIGVGEFGMNEWNRLADVSTNTRRYLGKGDVQNMTSSAAIKLAKIHRAKARLEHEGMSGVGGYKNLPEVPEAYPTAIELPAEVPSQPQRSPPLRPSYESGRHDNLEVPGQQKTPSPRSSSDNHSHLHSPVTSSPRLSADMSDKFTVYSPTPSEYMTSAGADKIAIMSVDEAPKPPIINQLQNQGRVEPPPLPPKTPIQEPGLPMARSNRPQAPYPLEDGPPPAVNMARKPDYKGR